MEQSLVLLSTLFYFKICCSISVASVINYQKDIFTAAATQSNGNVANNESCNLLRTMFNVPVNLTKAINSNFVENGPNTRTPVSNASDKNIKHSSSNKNTRTIPWMFDTFHDTNNVYKFIDDLQSNHPDNVEVSTIGYTSLGTPLKIVLVKADYDSQNNSKLIWVDGGTHAREWITVSSVLYVAKELTQNRHSLPAYMRNTSFVLMPIVNPDGYTYSHETDRMWRKNRMKTHSDDCVGIDLNRNWGYEWDGEETNRNPCSEIYSGPAPGSELEIKAIVRFVADNLPRIKGFITLHSYGQKILHPWAYTDVRPDDFDRLDRVAKSMSAKIYEKTSKTYETGSAASVLYRISGSSIDWMRGRADVRYAFALELRDDGPDNFELPATEIIPTGQEAFCAVSVLAETVDADDRRSGAPSRLPPSAVFRASVAALVVFKRLVYGR